jgi:lipopolysaccharide/colanic/teichoic acid biosynthesis glycosyltransferase
VVLGAGATQHARTKAVAEFQQEQSPRVEAAQPAGDNDRVQIGATDDVGDRERLTGMAQVAGRSDLDFNEEVRLDVWYMENWSMKLDFMILFKTPWAVLKRRKAE